MAVIDLRGQLDAGRHPRRAHHPCCQTPHDEPPGEGSDQPGSVLSHRSCAPLHPSASPLLYADCHHSQRMALSSFQLFIGQVATAPELIKVRVLQIMFDILMVHEGAFLGADSTNGQKIIEFLLQLLETEESDRVQALLCMGLAKLMLAGMVADEQALSTLVLMYISPETAKNQELRQCLSYFFPVYSYSTRANQDRMRKVSVSARCCSFACWGGKLRAIDRCGCVCADFRAAV